MSYKYYSEIDKIFEGCNLWSLNEKDTMGTNESNQKYTYIVSILVVASSVIITGYVVGKYV